MVVGGGGEVYLGVGGANFRNTTVFFIYNNYDICAD